MTRLAVRYQKAMATWQPTGPLPQTVEELANQLRGLGASQVLVTYSKGGTQSIRCDIPGGQWSRGVSFARRVAVLGLFNWWVYGRAQS